ncbi:hypothetical protein BG844_17040 [Couchioplanes caeruleus subsp. caeruleus]|uniref:Uncharacterized protein n=1 Tax=Couchioplanes caeruleus subsp. caeruleus TaxID=56427 RepID=A0A1K0GPL1_9ACTN|nr:hypothetical protein BG844_17040 [Couchioplanes caeruleus subsp. caeruleus]
MFIWEEKDVDLDPEIEGGRADFTLYWNHLYEHLVLKDGWFARVSSPTAKACDDAPDWDDEILAKPKTLVCLKTDLEKYVVLSIVSTSGQDIHKQNMTYRVVYKEP